MKKAALISVSDRTGLVELAKGLSDLGFVILATSGSGKYLSEQGIEVESIERYTAQKEILDGRVKTLHPKIHAGLLAKRSKADHIRELKENGIYPIDVAVVNLYPFLEKVKSDAAKDPDAMIEFIDIGGPTMIRAAAKNHRGVLPVMDPSDYPAVLEFLRVGSALGRSDLEFRQYLAAKVFTAMAHYDLEVARYLSTGGVSLLSEVNGTVLKKSQDLRYGENPHQKAAYYRPVDLGQQRWQQLHGKELSYNNLLDVDAALRLSCAFSGNTPTSVIIKHANPCGVAKATTLIESLRRAKLSDPRSHFGGILAFTTAVDVAVAESIREDFAEVVLAPEYAEDALKILQTSKNLRVIKIGADALADIEWRGVLDGVLLQERDKQISSLSGIPSASKRAVTPQEIKDLEFAWTICAHVKSNAITIVRDEMLLGSGAGQMSRIDSVELAIHKAKTHNHKLQGAVAASDAFFPFTDGLEALAAAGITAIVAPSGAKKDEEVLAAANRCGVSLVFAPERHFRH